MHNEIVNQCLAQLFRLELYCCFNVLVCQEDKFPNLRLLSCIWLNPWVLGSPGHFSLALFFVRSVTLSGFGFVLQLCLPMLTVDFIGKFQLCINIVFSSGLCPFWLDYASLWSSYARFPYVFGCSLFTASFWLLSGPSLYITVSLPLACLHYLLLGMNLLVLRTRPQQDPSIHNYFPLAR